MYIPENQIIDKENAAELFKDNFYPKYIPKLGNLGYIQKRWL
jgi:hypothetical protein